MKPTIVEPQTLTENEKRIIEVFRSLSASNKQAFLNVLFAFGLKTGEEDAAQA